MDTEYNAPNTALVGKKLTLTADSTDGKATDFIIGGAFCYDDYSTETWTKQFEWYCYAGSKNSLYKSKREKYHDYF